MEDKGGLEDNRWTERTLPLGGTQRHGGNRITDGQMSRMNLVSWRIKVVQWTERTLPLV